MIKDERTDYEKLQDDLLSILVEESEKSIKYGEVTDRVNRMQVNAFKLRKERDEYKRCFEISQDEIKYLKENEK